MSQNPFEPSRIYTKGSRSVASIGSRRLWIFGLMLAELVWHFLLYLWVLPPQNKWDMGGVAATMQLAISVGLVTTILLTVGMLKRIRLARVLLIAVSLGATILGGIVVLNRKSTSWTSSAFVHELIYVTFNLTVVVLLLCVRYYRYDAGSDGDQKVSL